MENRDDPEFGTDNKIFTRKKMEAARKKIHEILRRMDEEEKEKRKEEEKERVREDGQ